MAGEVEVENDCEMVVDLDKLRALVRSYVDRHQYETALFWSDKVLALSGGDPQDVYWTSQCLYHTGQFHRAGHLIKLHQLDKNYLACRYLAAKCHFECKEWQESLDVLDQSEVQTPGRTSLPLTTPANMPHEKMDSSIYLLRGKVYEAMDNRCQAAECFREALRIDVRCYEAFHGLINHHMLSAQEEHELLESLPFKQQCSEEELELLQFLYENKLKKYHKPSELVVPPSLEKLNQNLDVIVSLAERHYYNCDFQECEKFTSQVLNKDPFNAQCLPLHIAVLVELKKSNALFYLAHKLVDLYPNKAVAWFAVGCYYLLVEKNEPARRYFSKATTLDRAYGPAWLAFGHSFAVENEHDQAMAAYFTASQLMKGCHLPVLYIGLEYGLTNNTKLAEQFFSQALSIAPEDPFVLHEIGVIAFQNKDWEQAEKYLSSALAQLQTVSREVMAEKWEPLLNNLGHTCRKIKKYEAALEYHQQARVLCPRNPSTLSAIGYVHVLMGNNAEAVDYFHKALGLRRDDTFSTTMLSNAIELLMTDMSPCDGVPDVLPAYEYSGKLDTSQVGASQLEEGDQERGEEEEEEEPAAEVSLAAHSELSGLDSLEMSGMDIDTSLEDG